MAVEKTHKNSKVSTSFGLSKKKITGDVCYWQVWKPDFSVEVVIKEKWTLDKLM